MKRRHISLTTKLAAALLVMHPEDREAAKQLTASQYVSLFEFDHVVLHTWDGSDHFSNLTPLYIPVHRRKSAKDAGRAAKVKRIDAKWSDFMHAISNSEKLARRISHYRWPKRKIPSRPFRRDKT